MSAHSGAARVKRFDDAMAAQLTFSLAGKAPSRPVWSFWRRPAPKVTEVFTTYWRFAYERQEVFFRRLAGTPPPWTHDPILQTYRFTNPYRAADRVSQYLIRYVTYAGDLGAEEVFFRTILFKLFNKIETWQLLESELGSISFAEYDFRRYAEVLARAWETGKTLYSAAYVMPAARTFPGARKHETHLRLLEHLMKEQVPQRLADAPTLETAFRILRNYPMMGDFLAYQYLTDLNYSAAFDWAEDFIVPGPGARDGLRKCIADPVGLSEADLIKLVADMQEEAFERLGLTFQTIWGRRLQLVDCQNLFCEVDKYARVAHPEVVGRSGRSRIKQHFRARAEPFVPWFPPKWGLNERVQAWEEEGFQGIRRGRDAANQRGCPR